MALALWIATCVCAISIVSAVVFVFVDWRHQVRAARNGQKLIFPSLMQISRAKNELIRSLLKVKHVTYDDPWSDEEDEEAVPKLMRMFTRRSLRRDVFVVKWYRRILNTITSLFDARYWTMAFTSTCIGGSYLRCVPCRSLRKVGISFFFFKQKRFFPALSGLTSIFWRVAST